MRLGETVDLSLASTGKRVRFARNITQFLTYLIKDQKLNLNLEDEIVRETLLTRDGEIVNARVREFFKLPALAVTQ